ncbi:MAG: hypothetical protein JW940_00150 [Polyangiaceae bacterium]|nr:hypothetical protein [Polyangiaceae bacterium]
MDSPHSSIPQGTRSRLRVIVSAVEREISRLPGQTSADAGPGPPSALAAAFANLVQELALGPEPERRECPVCKHTGMRAATVCGYCWTKLTPLPERDGVAA